MAATIRSARQLDADPPEWTRRARVVVVGAGAAGLTAAMQLAGAGVDTVLLSSGTLFDSATAISTGRLSTWTGPHDYEKALRAGAGVADGRALRRLLETAPLVRARLMDFIERADAAEASPYETNGRRVQRSLVSVVRAMAARPGTSLRIDASTRGVDVLTDGSGR
uniref:FAD-dependent oxidoreductase n=1 Tax=uncultured Propionibacterium sp. TaxID=218066 RepID=UPI00292CF94E